MPVELKEVNDGRVLELHVTGKLVKEDYDVFLPEVERLVKQYGKLCLLIDMHDFHGWTGSAAWEDFKFGVHHFNDIERLAMIGETQWEQAMAVFGKPFTAAKVRYFDHTQATEAREWLAEK